MPRKGPKEASQAILWIRELVLCGDYKFSQHLQQKIGDGEFSFEDIENCIAHGLLQRWEKDEKGGAIDGKKYIIVGPCKGGLGFDTVGKIIKTNDGEAYYFNTAYRRI